MTDSKHGTHLAKQALMIFEDELELIAKELEHNVIRTANSRINPQNPLRPNKEITYDSTGQFVLPNSKTGISLAASMRQLKKIISPGIEKWLLLVDRNCPIPKGFRLKQDNSDHWSVIVTEKMTKIEYDEKIRRLVKEWKVLGRFVRYV